MFVIRLLLFLAAFFYGGNSLACVEKVTPAQPAQTVTSSFEVRKESTISLVEKKHSFSPFIKGSPKETAKDPISQKKKPESRKKRCKALVSKNVCTFDNTGPILCLLPDLLILDKKETFHSFSQRPSSSLNHFTPSWHKEFSIIAPRA